MLSQPHRLPSLDIPHVLRFGKRVVRADVQLIYAQSDSGNLDPAKGETDVRKSASRFAFIVSTKVDKRATHRNRIRRLLSESVRLRMDSIKPGVDGVFVAKKGLGDIGIKDAEKIIVELFFKAKLLNNEL
jgi:ribonuclease P protein component